MNEENVNKKEKKSKRKLIMILIIILFVLLISSSITYYFLVYTKNNDKNIKEKVNEVSDGIVYYFDVDKEIKKYNKYINVKKSEGKTKSDEPTEIYIAPVETGIEVNDPYMDVLVYIDKNNKFVFENKETKEKYDVKGIDGEVSEYITSMCGEGGDMYYENILALTEDGKVYIWENQDGQNYNEFMFTLAVNSTETIKGIIARTAFTDYNEKYCPLNSYFAITDNGVKRIDSNEKVLKEDIKKTYKILSFYSIADNIIEEDIYQINTVDLLHGLLNIDKEKHVSVCNNSTQTSNFSKCNDLYHLPEKINENDYLLDKEKNKIKVNYSFSADIDKKHSICEHLFLITEKGKIYSFDMGNYDFDETNLKLYNNKTVKSVKIKKLYYYYYKSIKITYTDNSVEIFKVKDK